MNRRLTDRRRPQWAILLILAGYLVLATAYGLFIPLGEAPDEVSHYAYMRVLAREHHLPAPAGMAFGETFQPPLYYLAAAVTNFGVDEGGFSPQANADFNVDEPSGPPNLLLHPRREDFPFRGGALAWHLARLFSVLLGAITVWATYRLALLLFPEQPPLAWSAAGFVAFLPEFLFLSGAVNNDNLSTMIAALLLWRLARLASTEPTRSDGVWIGILLGLGVVTKTSLWTFWPIAFAVIVWRSRARERVSLLGWTAGIAVLLAAPWLIRNMVVFGDPLGWAATRLVTDPRTVPLAWPDYVGLGTALFISFWGAFGGAAHLLFPRRVLLLLLFLCGLSLAGLVRAMWLAYRKRQQLEDRIRAYAILLGHLAVVLVAFWFWSRSVLGTGQGRLLFPALPTFAILFVAGLAAWIPKRRRGGLARAFVVVMFLFGGGTLLLWLRPLYAATPRSADVVIPPDITPADFRFGKNLRLVGFEWPATVDDRVAPGTTLTLTLVWRADADIREDDRLVLRLVDRRGRPVWLKEGSPSAGWDTTDRWQAGDVVVAHHKITLPSDIPPGWTRLLAGVRPAGSKKWLPLYDGAGNPLGDTVMLGQMTVKKK